MAGFDYSLKNKRWQAVRKRVLLRDGNLCREARRYGRKAEANTVHHVWPAERYPEWAYEDWNLISLTAEAHNAMHDREHDALTALGEAWRKRCPPPPGGRF